MTKMIARTIKVMRRAFSEFLLIPVLEVAGFTLLSWLAYWFDSSAPGPAQWGVARRVLDAYIGSAENAVDLLKTVATSLITISSITFSILLLAVQQSSAALTNQVVDQYIRRRSNQWFFGFFVGASVYALNCLALTRQDVTPVLATTVALLLTALCVFALIVLIYSTLDQTRPASIISRIHGSTLAARERQLKDLARVSGDAMPGEPDLILKCDGFGYVTAIDVGSLCDVANSHPELRIAALVRLGDPVYHRQDILALSHSEGLGGAELTQLRSAVRVEKRRDLLGDPMFGVDQLGNIAWTSTSTAKSNPAAALVACHALNDLLWRWSHEGRFVADWNPGARVHVSDDLPEHMACAYESLMVAASESMQHQTLAEIVRGLTRAMPHMPSRLLDQLDDVIVRSLSALGDHVPTATLERELGKLGRAFRKAGRSQTAGKIADAWDTLAHNVGVLHSRSDRVPG